MSDSHTERQFVLKSPMTVDPRERSYNSWRARKAVMASRGVRSGPQVDEADAAMKFHRFSEQLRRGVESGLLSESFAAATFTAFCDEFGVDPAGVAGHKSSGVAEDAPGVVEAAVVERPAAEAGVVSAAALR